MNTATALVTMLVTAVMGLVVYGYARAGRPWMAAILLGMLGMWWAGWAVADGWRPFDSGPDPQITLRSSQWQCARSHEAEAATMAPAGKAMVPATIKQQVCDRYERR